MELKKIFASGTGTFINGSAILINNEPKNPRDWIILDIWTLENSISAEILFLNAYLNFFFCFVVDYNSWIKLLPLKNLIFILKVISVWILAVNFNLFSYESNNLTFTLLYSNIYTIHKIFRVPL